MDSAQSDVVRNALAVITNIFSAAAVTIALSLTDLIELLFVGGIIICILILLMLQAIKSLMIKSRYKGNEILIVVYRFTRKIYLFFYLITIQFFVVMVTEDILTFDLPWYLLIAFSIQLLSWLFITNKE